jgi:acyl-CoA synthetase (AMP-forming)/AMP-acid ligase II
MAGAQVTILPRFAPDTFLGAISRYRATYFSAVPAIYARLAVLPADQLGDVSSVRFAVCGAAPVPAELLRRSEARFGFPIIEGYGLTEGTCASTVNPLDGGRKPGTVGVALPGQQVATMRPDDSFAAAGEPGEVVIRGANVMRGYLNRPEATAETIVDGWLHTGDVGVLDVDGYLTIVDRIKDMIIRGGENIYPQEIESVLAQHDAVLEVAVIGAPHEVYGELPVAYVVTYPHATVTPDELLALCRGNLTKIKIPVAINIVPALPKNPVGKIDKPALRALHS